MRPAWCTGVLRLRFAIEAQDPGIAITVADRYAQPCPCAPPPQTVSDDEHPSGGPPLRGVITIQLKAYEVVAVMASVNMPSGTSPRQADLRICASGKRCQPNPGGSVSAAEVAWAAAKAADAAINSQGRFLKTTRFTSFAGADSGANRLPAGLDVPLLAQVDASTRVPT